MAENKILPWAQTGTANVLSDADYAADVASGGLYSDGVKTGQASSKQANKTWRQATAPGSGLAQFLVDNLGVDVTDADTPSTFSARIANAVLKLAQISPFNQSWATATGGYRKYAIVSDSSGNFWVSTADQNMTVPGAIGAKWQSLFNGYATEAWAEGRYVRSPLDPSADNRVSCIGMSKSVGQVYAVVDGGPLTFLQTAGDYATNTALQSEASSRSSADTNLQNQVNNRVLKTGDFMTGGLTIRGGAGYATDFSPSNPSQGSYINYPGYASIGSARGVSFGFGTQEHVGTETLGLFTLSGTAIRNPVYWYMRQSGRFSDSIGGNYAYVSELPLPAGMHCQLFSVAIPNPCPQEGWVVNIPRGWSAHSFVTACDTGGNVYAVSAKVENATQARLWAKYPTNGAWANGGWVNVTSYGYY